MLNFLDRLTLPIAPRWTLQRLRARVAATQMARHYEAAQGGRRTAGWARSRGDANAVSATALAELRMHARDLVRNNGWARRARQVIANNTVGWGIVPRASGSAAPAALELWKTWADSTQCETAGRHTFYSLQALCMRSTAEAGEVLIRRRSRRPEDGLAIPLQLQVLEADYLDTSRDTARGDSGGPIIQGVEFDAVGRRKAYWLFPEHPGNTLQAAAISKRVPASEVIHLFNPERAGQVRGPSWFGAAIVPLKDLDGFEDAELLRQKIAACFAAFVTDIDGAGPGLGEQSAVDPLVETFEPGMISYLKPGQSVTTANPPAVTESGFTVRHLRRVAAALGVTYEDLTGDYSNVNYSSARMARLAHWANVYEWRYHMLIPHLCATVWTWAMDAAVLAGALKEAPAADWTCPPMPMLDPGAEGIAYQRLMRNGVLTLSDVIREQGGDPAQHLDEYAADMKALDDRKLTLDMDARKTSGAGLAQPDAPPPRPPE